MRIEATPMTSEASTRRREIGLERRDRTRNRLLVAAARVIAELGEKKAKIEDFIQAANVARGTFYNYYSTKTELLDDLWGSVGRDPFRAILGACVALPDPAERLGTQARLVLAYGGSHPSWGWLVYALSADAETVNRDLVAFPRPDLMLGRAMDRFRFTNLDSASDMVVGTIRRGLNAVLSEGRAEGYADEICLFILRALGVPESDAQEIVGRVLPSDLPVLHALPEERLQRPARTAL